MAAPLYPAVQKLLRMESLSGVLESLGPPSTCSQVWSIQYQIKTITIFHIERHGPSSVDTLSDLEESRVKSILFDSLEQFIAGKEDVQTVFSKLTESDTPPAVCGHVFKPGGMIHDICK